MNRGVFNIRFRHISLLANINMTLCEEWNDFASNAEYFFTPTKFIISVFRWLHIRLSVKYTYKIGMKIHFPFSKNRHASFLILLIERPEGIFWIAPWRYSSLQPKDKGTVDKIVGSNLYDPLGTHLSLSLQPILNKWIVAVVEKSKIIVVVLFYHFSCFWCEVWKHFVFTGLPLDVQVQMFPETR